MDLEILRKTIHTELEKYYKPLGYTLNSENGIFQNNELEVHWGVSSKYSDCIFFQPSLVVKNSQVSKILNLLFPDSPPITLNKIQGRDLAREFDCQKYDHLAHPRYDIDQGASYKVDSNTDYKKIVSDHSKYMEDVGFKFFHRVSSLRGLNGFINNRILEPTNEELDTASYQKKLMRFFTNYEIKSGPIIAFLDKKHQNDILLTRYRKVFSKYDNILSDLLIIEDYFTT